jgi:hypothetical protein
LLLLVEKTVIMIMVVMAVASYTTSAVAYTITTST